MDLMQFKPSTNDLYNGFYDLGNNEAVDIDITDNLCRENNDPTNKLSKSNNTRRNCDTYFSKQSMTPSLDDILNANVICDEKLQFDFEEQVLPPCFDSLINAEDQILASPDLNILKLTSPDLIGLITAQEDDTDPTINSRDSLTNDQQNNEMFQNINRCHPTKDHDLIGSNAPEEMDICQVPEESKNETTTPMSEKEIQLIKEVNKTLDGILPIKTEETRNERVLDNEFNVDNDLFEPLQQVPCIEDSCMAPRSNRDRGKSLDSNNHRSSDNDFYNELARSYDNADLADIYDASLSNICNKAYDYNKNVSNKNLTSSCDKIVSPSRNRDLRNGNKNLQNNHCAIISTDYNKNVRSSCSKTLSTRHRKDVSDGYSKVSPRKKLTTSFNRNLPNGYNKSLPNNYSADMSAVYNKELTNVYYNNNLPPGYNDNNLTNNYCEDYCDYYNRGYFMKTEPEFIENSYFLGGDDSMSLSFYDIIEEQVRHQNLKRGDHTMFNRNILDTYLPGEQDLIRRYIEGDKGHLPIPPFNTEIQEIIKRERKKHKNRVAASKCRKKKLEREAQLEVRVNCLKDRSVHLNTVVRDLRNQATNLKQRIMEHINAGCNLNSNVVPSGINTYFA